MTRNLTIALPEIPDSNPASRGRLCTQRYACPDCGKTSEDEDHNLVLEADPCWMEELQDFGGAQHGWGPVCNDCGVEADLEESTMDAQAILLHRINRLDQRIVDYVRGERLLKAGGTSAHCEHCNSTNVAMDSHVEADAIAPHPPVISVYDDGHVCVNCRKETHIEHRPLSAHARASAIAANRKARERLEQERDRLRETLRSLRAEARHN